ncbi:MAG TPA: hypothetical protein DF783_08760, partial [Acidimicrobiaceae bacterium]|nr:hypothetical protein [Acidimicrobiaceae bacterium]
EQKSRWHSACKAASSPSNGRSGLASVQYSLAISESVVMCVSSAVRILVISLFLISELVELFAEPSLINDKER